jgi:hypothetical protein
MLIEQAPFLEPLLPGEQVELQFECGSLSEKALMLELRVVLGTGLQDILKLIRSGRYASSNWEEARAVARALRRWKVRLL